ncbi:MAG: ATP-dependent RNA helicase HrpA [Pseudomonadota bacterium]
MKQPDIALPRFWQPAALTYPEALPVSAHHAEIAEAIRTHQAVIVCGATGSGKTTQLPKICLQAGRGVIGRIACTQPRRIAARTVAARLAQELGTNLGEGVGYKVRFTDQVRNDTVIKVLTDGMLLAETSSDRDLRAYDTIIIDEAHERSLNIDFLLGYLRQLMSRRPELKVIITSATIDAERFSKHFGGAPVIEVSGRTYPVEIRYRPIEAPERATDGTKPRDTDEERQTQAILDATDELARLGEGDILIFLPGEREIRDLAEALRKHHPPHTEILPLFARLSVQEQQRIFHPSNARRIVLATNVAETSLTVPGIRYVIDPGQVRLLRYSPRTKVDQLQVEPVSQASANQRAGRCGRVAAGVCIRLYSELEYSARPAYTDPEILRTSLAGVILRMSALRLGAAADFPFLDAPAPRLIADGYQLLEELNAVSDQRRLTPIGKQLAKLPLDPKIGRVLLAAQQSGCLAEALVICAALSVQDPRERPPAQSGAADDRHRAFANEHSDFIGILKLWEFYDEALKHKKSNRKLIDQCREHFLNPQRLREWREVHGQLASMAREMGLRINEEAAKYEAIHQALLAGFLGNIGVKMDEGGYQGARGIKFHIHPGSALAKKSPKWVMAAELTETTRLYARTVAKIEPEWLEAVAEHLLKRNYFDPHWQRKTAQVSAFEQVQLFGLIIVPRRSVHYGTIDPVESRRIFIRSALVAGEYDTRAPFFAHNGQLIEEIVELEHKARRQDVLVDEERLFAFFDARIPAGIVNGSGFDQWRRDAERENPRLLYLSRDDLMRHGAESVTEDWFPQTLTIDAIALPLSYRFEPGHPLDGMTVTIPLALLNTVPGWHFDWLVPGMLREKLTWYVKALPKHLRRVFVPVPDSVTALMETLAPTRPLTEALASALTRRSSLKVTPADWSDAPPAHLSANFRVIDGKGRELASGRDLIALRKQLGEAAQLTFRAQDTTFEKTGFKRWEFGDVPAELRFDRAGQAVTGYPALADDKDSVALRLFDTRQAAERAHRAGLARLFRLTLTEQFKFLEKNLPDFTRLALAYRSLGDADSLREELIRAIAERACLGDDELPRTQQQFETQLSKARARLKAVADALSRTVGQVLDEYTQIQGKLKSPWPHVVKDIQDQLSHLVYAGFISATPWARLQHLPRYLKGINARLSKLPARLEHDQRHATALISLTAQYRARLDKHRKAAIDDPALDEFRWQLEELRISLFAQELKTPQPVSVKRLQKLWENVLH